MNILNGFNTSNTSLKTYNIETTIMGFHKEIDTDNVIILCNPKLNGTTDLLLKSDNPDFKMLYNKLVCGKTYKFIYMASSYNGYSIEKLFFNKLFCNELDDDVFNVSDKIGMEIVDIVECTVYRVFGVITELLDLGDEYGELKHYKEIIIKPRNGDNFSLDNKKKRIILEKKYIPDNIMGKLYNIDCIKTFGYDFYTLP